MLYKRQPFRQRKYSYSTFSPVAASDAGSEPLKGIDRIPLPNELEYSPDNSKKGMKNIRSFVNGIFKNNSEELILIGLIFLLLQEGIEDEFLLIILVYVLIAGFE